MAEETKKEKKQLEKFVLFDWDDNLMVTDHYQNNKKKYEKIRPYIRHPEKRAPKAKSELSRDEYQLYLELKELDQLYLTIFTELNKIGTVYLVTNGSGSWFWDVSIKYFPLLESFFKKHSYLFYSARDMYAAKHPEDHTKWKKFTFEDIIEKHLELNMKKDGYFVTGALELVCASDQQHDLNNCIHIYKKYKMARYNGIKLEERLTPREMLQVWKNQNV
jgi:hypothetical protein